MPAYRISTSAALTAILALGLSALPLSLDGGFAKPAFAKDGGDKGGGGGGDRGDRGDSASGDRGDRGSSGGDRGSSSADRGNGGNGKGSSDTATGRDRGNAGTSASRETDKAAGKSATDKGLAAKEKNGLGALNAAHASPTALANASPNSRVGMLGAYAEAVKDGKTAEEAEKALSSIGNRPVNEDIIKEVNALLGVDFKTEAPPPATGGTTAPATGGTTAPAL
jgi:hypothetical protein